MIDRERQAATFVRLHRRHPRGTWQEHFAHWAGPGGKDFQEADFAAIRRIVRLTMLGRGDCTAEMDDWYEAAA